MTGKKLMEAGEELIFTVDSNESEVVLRFTMPVPFTMGLTPDSARDFAALILEEARLLEKRMNGRPEAMLH